MTNRIRHRVPRFVLAVLGTAALSLCAHRSGFARQVFTFKIYVVKPITSTMILPDTGPASLPGRIADAIPVVATPGEYEAASFVARPSTDIKALKVQITDLKAGKRVIQASSVDIKVVKCWYQSKGAWKTYNRLGYSKVLVPELLLHDGSLVKVDTERKENYLKLIYSSGEKKYVWISKKPDIEPQDLDPHDPAIYEIAPGIGVNTPIEQFPVKDSPTLAPVDLKARKNQQFWLSIHVPADAGPGIYRGKIKLCASGCLVKDLALQVRVLPFKLSEPRTFYDPDREFTSSIYYRGILDPAGKGYTTTDLKSEQQFRAELRNMYLHGVTNPALCIPYGKIVNDQKLFRKMLRLRKEAGITGPFYMVFDLTLSQQDQASLEELKKKASELIGIAKECGVPEFYFYGIDEAGAEVLLTERAAWQAVHEVGGKVMVSGYQDAFQTVGDLLDLLILNGAPKREEARKWHSVGHQIWCYAYPQAGIENPEIYRRNFGLLLWKAEYDGAATYTYQTGAGCWNDFNDIMRKLTFTYPTVDGVIDTIAWEGYREGIDDIRYGSTLKSMIEWAKRGNDPGRKRRVEEAEEFLDKLDVKGNLDANRAKIIDYILSLKSRT